MSTVVQPYLDKISTIEQEIEFIGGQIIMDFSEEIMNFVKNKQLGLGLDSKGNPLVHPKKRRGAKAGKRIGLYEYSTENWKSFNETPPKKPKSYNQPYNFQWSGNTFDGMFIDVKADNAFVIFSKDFKARFLEQEYQTKLFDLTDEHNDWINDNIMLPNLQKYILDKLFT